MFAPAVLCLRLFYYEEQKGDVIAVVAIASFLAWTRNLMVVGGVEIFYMSVCCVRNL